MNLVEQNVIIKHITSVCYSKIINMWKSLLRNVPNNIYNFARRALIFGLPMDNKSNLHRWRIIQNSQWQLCDQPEMQLYVLPNCSQCLNRYTWRHNSVLNTILRNLSHSSIRNISIYADLKGRDTRRHSEIFDTKRQDIVLLVGDKVIVIELTVCFETNTSKSRSYKQECYKDLQKELKIICTKSEIYIIRVNK